MPVPTPQPGESQEQFISRCIPAVKNEDPGKPDDQVQGMCFASWDESKKTPEKPKKDKLDLITDFKKMVQKNDLEISDDELLELFQKITKKEQTKTFTQNYKLDSSGFRGPDEYEIKVFPLKKVYFEKYKQHIDFNHELFNQMIANFNNPKLFKPFMDKQHELDKKYADITDLFIKEDGLYAVIRPNQNGIEAIKKGDYSYISPEWGDRVDLEKKLHKNVLWAITLTNIPAFEGELPQLQQQMKLTKKEGTMDINTKILSLTTRLKTNYKLEGGMIDPAFGQEVLDILVEAQTKLQEAIGAKEQAEEGQEKAEEMAMTVNNELSKLKSEVLEKECDDFFKNAVETGRLEPAEVDDWKSQYAANKEFVTKMISKRPEKSSSFQLSNNIATHENFVSGLSSEDRQIALDAGYDLSKPEEAQHFKTYVLEK